MILGTKSLANLSHLQFVLSMVINFRDINHRLYIKSFCMKGLLVMFKSISLIFCHSLTEFMFCIGYTLNTSSLVVLRLNLIYKV